MIVNTSSVAGLVGRVPELSPSTSPDNLWLSMVESQQAKPRSALADIFLRSLQVLFSC
ncbi:hypothetical protein [Nostoc sp.]|uniref:hypothetical protein n=1 Tax=Nostoc sp. TaxID=1180 RepID=UPI002FFCB680